MKSPGQALLVVLLVPLLTGCFATHVQPLPEAPELPPTDIRGVVVTGDGASDERVEFQRIDHVEWTDSTVIVTGVSKASPGESPATGLAETRVFPLASITGVLVKEVDPTRMSILIGAVGVGAAAVAALLFTGQADRY